MPVRIFVTEKEVHGGWLSNLCLKVIADTYDRMVLYLRPVRCRCAMNKLTLVWEAGIALGNR